MTQRLINRLLVVLLTLPFLGACSKVEDQPLTTPPTIEDLVGTYEGLMTISSDRQTSVVAEVTREAIVFERFPAEYLAMSVFPDSEHAAIRESLKIEPLALRYKAGLWRSNIIMGIEPREFTFEITLGERLHTFTAKILSTGEAAYGGVTKLFTCYVVVQELLMDGEPARSFSPMAFVLEPTLRRVPQTPAA